MTEQQVQQCRNLVIKWRNTADNHSSSANEHMLKAGQLREDANDLERVVEQFEKALQATSSLESAKR
jgi:RNA polymerase-binding transcription factor DksA